MEECESRLKWLFQNILYKLCYFLISFVVLQGDPTSPSWKKSVLSVHWKVWCWSWNSNTLATWCEKLTLKRRWCWERLKVVGEGDDRGWDGWMASSTPWTWVWVNYRSWWWSGSPGMLQSMESRRGGHDWETELNWTGLMVLYFKELKPHIYVQIVTFHYFFMTVHEEKCWRTCNPFDLLYGNVAESHIV